MEAPTLKGFLLKAMANILIQNANAPILPRYTQDIQGDIGSSSGVNIWKYTEPSVPAAKKKEYIVITIPYRTLDGPSEGLAARLPASTTYTSPV